MKTLITRYIATLTWILVDIYILTSLVQLGIGYSKKGLIAFEDFHWVLIIVTIVTAAGISAAMKITRRVEPSNPVADATEGIEEAEVYPDGVYRALVRSELEGKRMLSLVDKVGGDATLAELALRVGMDTYLSGLESAKPLINELGSICGLEGQVVALYRERIFAQINLRVIEQYLHDLGAKAPKVLFVERAMARTKVSGLQDKELLVVEYGELLESGKDQKRLAQLAEQLADIVGEGSDGGWTFGSIAKDKDDEVGGLVE